MLKTFPYLIFIIVFICSCTSKKTEFVNADSISKLQEKATAAVGDSSYHYLKNAEKLLLKNSFSQRDSLLTENYFALGEYFQSAAQSDSSVYYNFKGIQSIDSITNNKEINHFYNTYYQLSSLLRYGDCLQVAEEFENRVSEDDYELVSIANFFRQNIALNEYNYALALEHNNKIISLLERLNDRQIIAPSLISRAEIFYYQNEKQKAYAILDTLISYESELDYDSKRQLYGDYAVYTFYDNQFDKSLLFNQKTLDNIRISKIKTEEKNISTAIAYSNIAEIYIETGSYNLAQKYIDSVYGIGFDKVRVTTQRNILKYQLLLESLTKTNERKVNKLLDSIFSYQDKSYTKKYNQELLALNIETEKKEEILAQQQAAEIKSIKLESRLIVVIIASLLIFIVGVLYYFLRKYRQEKKALYLQQRLLRTQMSPHFIFNTLSSIHNVMSTNTERAATYLIKFSKLLRLVLENSLENYVPLEDEIDSIEQFLELQLLRFPEKFDYTISLKKLNQDIGYSIPPMLLQPFIENSILHGFKGVKYLGKINISISEKNKYLQCVIEDNGVGLQNKESAIHKSVSVGLISDFIEKTTRSKVSIVSKKEENPLISGVRISFLIPFKTNT
ncbi:hypothetical protein ULMA_05900 [Patiriisocius marinus]|uniref:Signal transduction histidine kinase internal region domain-containing protein n=1 Tax=Patiriisocius marinus TaxID=1397112 RepID=A0A5J4IVZ4_9FLAO|nr:histidine kinase [Patiriisocius marinus]GER58482.1 hypothetical protein ULMA_05900 [Patiriisocius marinus]